MKRGGWILGVAFALAAGCAHTKTTDDGTASKGEEDQKKEQQAADAKPHSPSQPRKAAPAGDPGAVPVASAPEALLAPGADHEIRQRLVAGGFLAGDAGPSDAATREGIRRFQRAQDLPATGVPDAETVKRLGLDPDKTFRRGTVKD
jgi:peptidoglycan hydrolase-like protein with peptidoglycan-binding domain